MFTSKIWQIVLGQDSVVYIKSNDCFFDVQEVLIAFLSERNEETHNGDNLCQDKVVGDTYFSKKLFVPQ